MTTTNDLINDLPKGPLDVYRKRATFDWKSFKLALEGETLLRHQVFKLTIINIHIK
jgi:acyl-CoA oxidase